MTSDYFQQYAEENRFDNFASWVILSPVEQSIKRKIESVGVPLKDWDISINYGIKTGFNDAFIIDGKKKDELIAADPKSAEIIRPILRGRDIKRYSYEFADLWLIHIPWHFPLHNNSDIQGVSVEAEQAFEKLYPAVYKHLFSFKEELSNRNKSETGIRYEWYALQRWGANYMDDFSRQKIIYREISDEMNACLDNDGFYVNNKCYIVTGDNLIYLLCFFNSPIFNKVILKSANITGGKGADFMNTINIPLIDKNMLNKLEKLYIQLMQSSSLSKVEIEINKILFSLYDFSDEEINYLLSNDEIKPISD